MVVDGKRQEDPQMLTILAKVKGEGSRLILECLIF